MNRSVYRQKTAELVQRAGKPEKRTPVTATTEPSLETSGEIKEK